MALDHDVLRFMKDEYGLEGDLSEMCSVLDNAGYALNLDTDEEFKIDMCLRAESDLEPETQPEFYAKVFLLAYPFQDSMKNVDEDFEIAELAWSLANKEYKAGMMSQNSVRENFLRKSVSHFELAEDKDDGTQEFDISLGLGRSHYDLKEYDKALILLIESLDDNPDSSILGRIGESAYKTKDYTTALTYLFAAKMKGNFRFGNLIYLGECYARHNKFNESLEEFNDIIERINHDIEPSEQFFKFLYHRIDRARGMTGRIHMENDKRISVRKRYDDLLNRVEILKKKTELKNN